MRRAGRGAVLLVAACLQAAALGGCGKDPRVVDVTTTVPIGTAATTTSAESDDALRQRAARSYAEVAAASNRRVDAAWNDVQATCRSSLWRQCAVALREFADVYDPIGARLARIEMPADAAPRRDAMVLAMNRATRTARDLATNLDAGRRGAAAVAQMRQISGAMTEVAGQAALLRARLGLPPVK